MSFSKKMRIINMYTASICLVLSLTACEDETNAFAERVPAVFTPEVSGGGEESTRVINDVYWSTRDRVGIYMVESGKSLNADAKFDLYKPDITEASISAELKPESGQGLYYPVSGGDVYFIAFSPCDQSKITDQKVTYSSFNTQNSEINMEKCDFVYYNGNTLTPKELYNKNKPKAEPKFKHKLSKITVNVVPGTGVSSVQNLQLTFSGMPTQVVCDLSDGTSTYSGSATLSPYRKTNTSSKTSFEAITPPRTASTTLTFTTSTGLVYAYPITSQKFNTEEEYVYNFTLTQTGIVLTNTTINGWGTGSVAWDGEKQISVSEKEITIYKDGKTGELTIKTSPDQRPGVQLSSVSTGTPNGNINWITDLNVTGSNGTYKLTYKVNATSYSRTGYLHITAHDMTLVIKVIQLSSYPTTSIGNAPGANCYILTQGGDEVFIPVSRSEF